MKIEEIKEIINNSTKSNNDFSLSDIFDVNSKAKMTLEMDRENQVYFYQINKEDLESASFTKEDIEKMVQCGWRFNESKNIFFKNV